MVAILLNLSHDLHAEQILPYPDSDGVRKVRQQDYRAMNINSSDQSDEMKKIARKILSVAKKMVRVDYKKRINIATVLEELRAIVE
jgi:hypothetical protein